MRVIPRSEAPVDQTRRLIAHATAGVLTLDRYRRGDLQAQALGEGFGERGEQNKSPLATGRWALAGPCARCIRERDRSFAGCTRRATCSTSCRRGCRREPSAQDRERPAVARSPDASNCSLPSGRRTAGMSSKRRRPASIRCRAPLRERRGTAILWIEYRLQTPCSLVKPTVSSRLCLPSMQQCQVAPFK